ncbi:hypothetical protein C8R44DRAFT_749057 [Mycena epipterygia]|nr:hypothetical protein C8R44DRAFT_749057 [Mycena epipterygia]
MTLNYKYNPWLLVVSNLQRLSATHVLDDRKAKRWAINRPSTGVQTREQCGESFCGIETKMFLLPEEALVPEIILAVYMSLCCQIEFWWYGCGMKEPEGDDNPDEVQCEECRLWAHIGCLHSDVDWDNPDVHFVCRRCREKHSIEIFNPNTVTVVPSPLVVNWKAPDDPRPDLILRTFYRSQKFCNEIENQIGKICLPRCMDEHFPHKNPTLTAIFNAAIPHVVKILAAWRGNWTSSVGLVLTPELAALIEDPVQALLKHKGLAHLLEPERMDRIIAVSSALLQVLAIQEQLSEPLNLNGDILNDLKLLDGRIVAWTSDSTEGLRAMLLGSGNWANTMMDLNTSKFNHAHSIYDPDYRPSLYHREDPSRFPTTEAIPVVVKRKADKELVGDNLQKRGKGAGARATAEETNGSKRAKGVKAELKRRPGQLQPTVLAAETGPRRLRLGMTVDYV